MQADFDTKVKRIMPRKNSISPKKKFLDSDIKSDSNKTPQAKSKPHQPLLEFLANFNKEITGEHDTSKLTPEEYLKEMRNYYESIIACMPGNVYWLDRNCVLLGGNDNLAKMFGLESHSDLAGLTYEKMSELANWTEGQGESFKRAELEVMTNGMPRYNVDEPPVVVNGKTRFYMSNKVPLYNMKQEIIGVIGISNDITERKQAEIALKEAKERAEMANRAKTEFLENMRHDIRTPLVGIVGFANIIKEEIKDNKIKEYVDNLTASSTALLDLLNEILEVIKVNSGEIPLQKKKFSLEKRLSAVVSLYQAKAKQKHLDLLFEYDEAIAPYLLGDSTRIHRIIMELISNALNFTIKGSVKLVAKLAKKSGRNQIIKIIVEDTGIGMEFEKQQEIFLQFKRLTPSYEGIYKGTGLGLSIVKQFVDELEGEIYVESKVGSGSTFTCVLPLKEALLNEEFGSEDITPTALNKKHEISLANKPKEKEDSDNDKATNRILLVEDQEIAARIVKIMLSNLGCKVDVAIDGKIAVEMARQNSYDLIFMDIGLPEIDGYEVTKRVRLHELNHGTHIPIIALTAHVGEENKQRCIEVGMNAVLSKPLGKEKAEDILNAFIPYRKSGKKLELESKENKLKGKVIDHKLALELAGGSEVMMQEMLGLLISGFQEDIKIFNLLYEKENWMELQKAVHKLKGGASYCGATRLVGACLQFENSLKENKTELFNNLFKQILAEINAVEEVFKK